MGRKKIEIGFVEPPKAWPKSHKVERLEGTRWYVERGTDIDFRSWLDDLQGATWLGLLIPYQWVPMYVGVSRAAVHLRANSGGLTVFSFIIQEPRRTLFGKTEERDSRMRYDYAVLSECREWRDALCELADYSVLREDERKGLENVEKEERNEARRSGRRK